MILRINIIFFSVNSIIRVMFVTETQYVFCEVDTELLNIIEDI
jgi:hypothetical protein